MTTIGTLCDGIADAASRIGDPAFYRGVLDAWRGLVDAESGQVMYFDRDDLPRYIDVFETAADVRQLYESGFGRWCPFYRYWHDGAAPGVRAMRELVRDDTDYGDYFSVFYPKTGMVDEIGLLLSVTRDTAIGVFLERSSAFRSDEVELLRRTWAPLHELHRAHVKLLAAGTMHRHVPSASGLPIAIFDRHGREVSANERWRETVDGNRRLTADIRDALRDDRRDALLDGRASIVVEPLPARFPLAPDGRLCAIRPAGMPDDPLADHFLAGQLTPRERDIVGLVLEGHPVAGIARRLGLSENTVKSHRKRLFAKLDITTERELFVMYVEHLTSAMRRI